MAQFGFATIAFTGRNGSGAISVPGLKAGDRVIWCALKLPNRVAWQEPGTVWEHTVSADDAIEQLSTDDLSANTAELIVFRGG